MRKTHLRLVAVWSMLRRGGTTTNDPVLKDYSTFARADIAVLSDPRAPWQPQRRRLEEVQLDEGDELHIEVVAVSADLLGPLARLRMGLKRDTSAFAEDYREVRWSQSHGFRVHRSGPPQCIYSGEAFHQMSSSPARASVCGTHLRGFVRSAITNLEVAFAESLGSYVILDARHAVPARTGRFVPPLPTRRRDDDFSWHVDDDLSVDDDLRKGKSSRPRSRRRRGLQSADSVSCAAQPEKVVENLIFNDASRYAALGDEVESDSAAIFAVARDIWFAPPSTNFGSPADGFGVWEPGVFDCSVEPLLVGQLTWRTNPEDVSYVEGAACEPDCCLCNVHPYRCTATEVHAACLLESVIDYADANRDALTDVFGGNEFDAVHLLSHRDFSGPTLGLAFEGAMCSEDSATIVQVLKYSTTDTAAIVAHEMGHLLDMEHDAEDAAVKNLMSPIFQSFGKYGDDAVKFSQYSKGNASEWVANKYADAGACLENEPILTYDTVNGTCGDGLVQDAEECDVGLVTDSRCCGGALSGEFACRLLPGCECADLGEPAHSCCRNGTVVPAGTICRDRVHDDCDQVEKCDGESPECPVDLYASPGTDCVTNYDDDAVFPEPSVGLCFRGDCKSVDDECLLETDGDMPFSCAAADLGLDPFACSQLACTNETDRTTNCVNVTHQVANGVPCASSQVDPGQCSTNGEGSSECVEFDDLKRYHWDERHCRCRDETGAIVDDEDFFCAGFDRVCKSEAPTTSPAPSASPPPSGLPTTYAPSTSVPTS